MLLLTSFVYFSTALQLIRDHVSRGDQDQAISSAGCLQWTNCQPLVNSDQTTCSTSIRHILRKHTRSIFSPLILLATCHCYLVGNCHNVHKKSNDDLSTKRGQPERFSSTLGEGRGPIPKSKQVPANTLNNAHAVQLISILHTHKWWLEKRDSL